jgi:hypothetical protein
MSVSSLLISSLEKHCFRKWNGLDHSQSINDVGLFLSIEVSIVKMASRRASDRTKLGRLGRDGISLSLSRPSMSIETIRGIVFSDGG